MKHRTSTVTVPGMTKSQPGTSVSYSTGIDWKTGDEIPGARLSVTRHYNHLPNQYGGRGKHFSLEADGKLFDSVESATKFCVEHGYLQIFQHDRSFRWLMVKDMPHHVLFQWLLNKRVPVQHIHRQIRHIRKVTGSPLA